MSMIQDSEIERTKKVVRQKIYELAAEEATLLQQAIQEPSYREKSWRVGTVQFGSDQSLMKATSNAAYVRSTAAAAAPSESNEFSHRVSLTASVTLVRLAAVSSD
jgi:hypothetical protein